MILVPPLVQNPFRQCAESGIITKEIHREAHNTLGRGERYRKPSTANHALKITANAEGLMSTLLVFETVPKVPLGNVCH